MNKKIVVEAPTKRVDGSLLNEKKIYKVAAYARVSTDKDDQLNSLETQVEFFNEYIKSKPDWELVKVYADEGISGLSRKNRVQFNQMVEDAKKGQIDIIFSKSISRFARNVIDTLTVTRELKAHNVYVYFQKENLNTKDPNADFMLNFMAGFAEEESKSISNNIKWSKRRLNKQGKVAVPYSVFLGYKKGENKFEMLVDKEQAPTVKLIYRLYLSGFSTTSIRDYLNKQNIKSATNRPWNCSTICSILSNEKYCGDAILQKTYVADIFNKTIKKNDGILDKVFVYDDHEAIIPKDTFNEVQVQRKIRRYMFSDKYIFSNKLYCTECNYFYRKRFLHHDTYKEPIHQWVCRQKFTDIKCKNIPLNNDELIYALTKITDFLLDEYTFVFDDLKELAAKIVTDKERLNNINTALDDPTLTEDTKMIEIFWRIIILRIEVYKERVLNFYFIDRKIIIYKLPPWSIKDKKPRKETKPRNRPNKK